jgi:hypothetical protein
MASVLQAGDYNDDTFAQELTSWNEMLPEQSVYPIVAWEDASLFLYSLNGLDICPED